MKWITRRSVLSALALCAVSVYAKEDPWPARPIKIIVGYSAGGPVDITARLVGRRLAEKLGQSVIVENKPGAGSNIATQFVAAASPDGYTLLFGAAPMAINIFLYKNLTYDPIKSFTPIIHVVSSPTVLAVAPNFPVSNLKEFIALAKKQPGGVVYGTSGIGGSQYLAAKLLEQAAMIQMTHVPYKGSAPQLNDLIGGQLNAGFQSASSLIGQIRPGGPRPIAVASLARLPQLPDTPTFAELGFPSVVVESWYGLFAPVGTPRAIVDRLNAEVNGALALPEFRESFSSGGAYGVGGTAQDFERFVAEEVTRYGKLIKSANIAPN